ncbi:S1 family peptidase [Archangium lipolyticum]|uniref:S1 family peptidase n=1 Tax=Archangium lipolyticum TaxID=2970465 RepID=UPI002149D5E6|nr:S1 family peptidase [Archangium lipolyticum]
MTKQRIVRAAVSGAVLWLAGWGGAAGAAEVSASPHRPRTLDDALLEVNTTVPDFGGMYYDEKGRLVVRLVHASAAPAARLAIAKVFGQEKIPAEGLVTEPATRTFAQLKALHERLTPGVLSVAGAVVTDVDEKTNRVAIGIESAEARARVEKVLERLEVDRDAVDIIEVGRILPTNVQGGWRPINGGNQIETPGKYCTLGFTAFQGNVLGFVSNSHCTQTQGGVEYTPAYQAVYPDLAGTEITDPVYTSGGTCPAGRICRYSDSAFFSASVPVNPLVAYTPGPFNLSISSWLEVPGKVLYPSQGQTVYKTGRTSGTTSGTIQWACATINSGGGPHTYFCNYIATNTTQNGAGGDSGSPVYFLSGNTATLTGIMWGAGSDPWHFAFSPLGSVQNELGIVPYCQGNVGC